MERGVSKTIPSESGARAKPKQEPKAKKQAGFGARPSANGLSGAGRTPRTFRPRKPVNAKVLPRNQLVFVEALGIEPSSENSNDKDLRAYPIIYIALDCAYRRARARAIYLFNLVSRPVTRRSTIQLNDALPEALAGLSVRRLTSYLIRQLRALRYRSQLGFPRIFTWISGPRHAPM